MTTAPIDPAKQYRTRKGHTVRLYAVSVGHGDFPVHGAVETRPGEWFGTCWAADGTSNCNGDFDLIEQPARFRREGWVNVYRTSVGLVNESKAEADREACTARIACIRVVIEGHEGEGLSHD